MWYTPKMPKSCFSKFIRNSETISWFALVLSKNIQNKNKMREGVCQCSETFLSNKLFKYQWHQPFLHFVKY